MIFGMMACAKSKLSSGRYLSLKKARAMVVPLLKSRTMRDSFEV